MNTKVVGLNRTKPLTIGRRVTDRIVSLRSRSTNGMPVIVERPDWDSSMTAVVICDMWNATQCVSAARRVAELAPRINEVAARMRLDGALIVHAPAGCMEHYAGTPARKRAQQAIPVVSPVPVDWHDRDAAREPPLPPALADDTPCSCEPGEPCTTGAPPYPWKHQIESIEIAAADAVTDDGNELLALLDASGIRDVVIMGVHAIRVSPFARPSCTVASLQSSKPASVTLPQFPISTGKASRV